jgi:hypothetical protein
MSAKSLDPQYFLKKKIMYFLRINKIAPECGPSLLQRREKIHAPLAAAVVHPRAVAQASARVSARSI